MFEDREDAGLKLCPKLKKYSDKKDVVVVGLTRGGILTAKAISSRLKLPLKALVVKKIGAFGNSEFAIGAMVSRNDIYWSKESLNEFRISKKDKKELISQKAKEIAELEKKLKIKKNTNEFKNKRIILVDDGVATGASVIAAQKYLRRNKVKEIILATPVVAFDTLVNIKEYFDRFIYLDKRKDFYAVGQFYKNFRQISDEEVAKILKT